MNRVRLSLPRQYVPALERIRGKLGLRSHSGTIIRLIELADERLFVSIEIFGPQKSQSNGAIFGTEMTVADKSPWSDQTEEDDFSIAGKAWEKLYGQAREDSSLES